MVEWKPLNKIVKSISTGLNPRQNFILNEEGASLYYVTVKEITTNKVVFSDSTDRITENAKQIINNRSKLSKGDILFSGIGTIGKVAYVDILTSNWDCSESVFLIKPNELETKGKYLAYILSSDIAKNQYERGAAGAIMKGVRKATLESLLIPIPSLSEQNRIVGILDTFTSAVDNLKEQIAQRRKQYEYYRDQLLDLEGKEGVEMKTLREFGDVTKLAGFEFTEHVTYQDSGSIIALRGLNVRDGQLDLSSVKYIDGSNFSKLNRSKLVKGDMLFTYVGTIGSVALIDEDNKYYLAPNVSRIRFDKEIVNPKFALHYFMCDFFKRTQINKYLNSSSMKNLSMENIRKFELYLPSLQEQQRIVSILDTFEASIANLEAQLKEREKQYEYYRNKLLTFE